jgi:tetratricopeptide (TPR) repeat protein
MRVAIFLSMFLTLTAQAEETPRGAARSHSKTGEDFFKQGRFAEARVEFEAAFALSQEPDLLYNVAKSFEREGSIKEALGAYDRYLALKPDDSETAARVQRMRASLMPAAPDAPPAPAFPAAPLVPPEPPVGSTPGMHSSRPVLSIRQ